MARWGFANAGRALEDDVAAFVQEASGGEFLDEGAVDGGLEGEVKIAEALLRGQPGKVQAGLDHALAAGGDLSFQQSPEEVRVNPVVGGGLLGERVELGVGGGGADLQEAAGGGLFVQGAHEAASAYALRGSDLHGLDNGDVAAFGRRLRGVGHRERPAFSHVLRRLGELAAARVDRMLGDDQIAGADVDDHGAGVDADARRRSGRARSSR
jgi:hypothetical protein